MHTEETPATLDQIISAPVTTDTRDWLNDEAKRQGRKRAEIIRFAISDYRSAQDAKRVGQEAA
jgi:hypothetical protein